MTKHSEAALTYLSRYAHLLEWRSGNGNWQDIQIRLSQTMFCRGWNKVQSGFQVTLPPKQSMHAVSSTAPKGGAGTEQGGAIPQARCQVVGGAL